MKPAPPTTTIKYQVIQRGIILNLSDNETIKVYHLSWSKYKWEGFFKAPIPEKDKNGVYQIYGNHPVYGKDTLLYIGKTKQSFRERLDLKQHGDFLSNHYSEFSYVHLGVLKSWDDFADGTDEEKIITDIEKLLINSHTPAFNSMDVKGILKHEIDNQFTVMNWNLLGDLLPEVSTLRYSGKYWIEE